MIVLTYNVFYVGMMNDSLADRSVHQTNSLLRLDQYIMSQAKSRHWIYSLHKFVRWDSETLQCPIFHQCDKWANISPYDKWLLCEWPNSALILMEINLVDAVLRIFGVVNFWLRFQFVCFAQFKWTVIDYLCATHPHTHLAIAEVAMC